MKSSEGFTSSQIDTKKVEKETALKSSELEITGGDNEYLKHYGSWAELLVDQGVVEILSDGEKKIESSTQSINVSSETLDAAKQEFGLDKQLQELQIKASQFAKKAKADIEALSQESQQKTNLSYDADKTGLVDNQVHKKSENIENKTASEHKLIEVFEKAGVESRMIKIENNGEFSEVIILNKKEVSTEKLVRIYRGINHLDDTVLKQTPYAMRSIDESGNLKILKNVRQEVDALVNNPTYENLVTYVDKVRASLSSEEVRRMEYDLSAIENGILDGYSTRKELIFGQIGHNGGRSDSGITPYISASFDPLEAANYGKEGLMVIDVPLSEIEEDRADAIEVRIKGALDKKYITAILPRKRREAEDDREKRNQQIQQALQKVYESVSAPLYNEQEMHIARENKLSDEKKYDEKQWQKDVAMVRQKRAERIIKEFPETNIDFQTAQQESAEQNTDVYKKVQNDIFDQYKTRLEKIGRNRKIDDYKFESRYGWEKFDSEKINDIMLVKLRELVLRLEQREKKE